MKRVYMFVAVCIPLCAQVAIYDTGSTNVPGVSITLEPTRHEAMVERHGQAKHRVALSKALCDRLQDDLKAAGSLKELPETHCMKSASFGSSLFVEYNGVRSGDFSCPQSDARADAIKKDAVEILNLAKR